jgi:Fic family protein
VAIIRHALKHPGQRYTFTSHQQSHNIVYQTARTDLLELGEKGVLEQRKKSRQIFFIAPADLSARLLKLEKEVLK